MDVVSNAQKGGEYLTMTNFVNCAENENAVFDDDDPSHSNQHGTFKNNSTVVEIIDENSTFDSLENTTFEDDNPSYRNQTSPIDKGNETFKNYDTFILFVSTLMIVPCTIACTIACSITTAITSPSHAPLQHYTQHHLNHLC